MTEPEASFGPQVPASSPHSSGAASIWDTAQAARFRTGAIGGFFLLGMPDGMLGVVWPSMRSGLHLPIDALGALLLGATGGYLVSAGASGTVLRRLHLGPLLVAATGAQALASASVGAGFSLVSLLASCVCLGACAGVIDSALSAAVSLWSRHRLMNLLHAAYGVGAALAPLAVTAAIVLSSWRLAYFALGFFQLLLALWWWRRRPLEAIRAAREIADSEPPRAGRRRAFWLGLLAFFFASGVEFTAASWTASYLEGRWLVHGSEIGLGVFCYWATLAGSRAVAAAHRRLRPERLALASTVVVIASSVVIWTAPQVAAALSGFALLGFGLGPLLPSLTSLTPQRVGHERAPGAIGWQLCAASLGASGCSAYAGLVLQREGFSATGPLLLGYAVVLGALMVALHRFSPVSRNASLGDTQ
jgi:fucose permease